MGWAEAFCAVGDDSWEGCGNRSVFSLKECCEDPEGMRGKFINIPSRFFVNCLSCLVKT